MSAWWSEALVRASWQGGLAVILFYGLVKLFRPDPAAQVWIWRLLIVKMILAILLPIVVLVPTQSSGEAVAASASKLPLFIGLLSLTGLLSIIALVIKDFRVVKLIYRYSSPVNVPELTAVANRIGVSREPEVRRSGLIKSPMLIGALRPTILVPADYALDTDTSQSVLAHELAHAKRKDLLWGWLCVIGDAVFFFHPLFHLAKHELRLAQELACDKAALDATQTRKAEYGRVLLRMVSSPTLEPLTGSVGALGLGPAGSLKKRLEALDRGSYARPLCTFALLLLAIAMLPAIEHRSQIAAQRPAVNRPISAAAAAGTPNATAPARLFSPGRKTDVSAPPVSPTRASGMRTTTPAGG